MRDKDYNVLFSSYFIPSSLNERNHLKNHSFIYDKGKDTWSLAPAYDISYSLNPLVDYKKTNRALSINGKRNNISQSDFLKLADAYTIKNPKGVIRNIEALIPDLPLLMKEYDIPIVTAQAIEKKLKDGRPVYDIWS